MSSGSSAQHQVRKADDAKLSANSEEFLNEVEEFLRSRRFIGPVHGFLADNCKAFSESTADGECTHEHEIIHQVRPAKQQRELAFLSSIVLKMNWERERQSKEGWAKKVWSIKKLDSWVQPFCLYAFLTASLC
mmetsp:Transcript_11449/g.30330  ORF Transcript_11449/g.30330 Transcript_11449/m.30330 type:complete len:133 (+) Transcript_11449:153-551(+)